MIVPSPDARFPSPADTYGRPKGEEKAMGILDFESQRERRAEMLREAESERNFGRRRRTRLARKLAGLLTISR